MALISGSQTVTTANLTDLLDGGASTLHSHAGGDLSFGGDTFGADKVIGSNDAYALSFETAGVVRMRIEGAAGSYHAAGAITMPTQPSVSAYNSASDNNVTGTGAGATTTIDFDTEVFDQNADFVNDTFTAPVTGKYLVSVQVSPDGLSTAANYHQVRIVASNHNWERKGNLTVNEPDQPNSITVSAIIDMDAGDTVTVSYFLQGMPSDSIDIGGDVNIITRISVQLIA